MARIPLSLIQQRFSDLMRSPDSSRADVYGIGVLDQSPVSIEDRIAVYQNAYRIRMFEALEEDFPDVRAVLGEADFSALIDAFIRERPSRYWSLAQLGERLPDFIATSEWSHQIPFLADLARLEWLRVLSTLAPATEPFDFSKLLEFSLDEQQRMVLELAPSVQMFQSPWSVYPLPQGHTAEAKVTRLVLFQKEGDVHHLELSEAQWNLFEMIARGEQVASLVESLAAVGENRTIDWFSTWVSLGIVTGLREGGAFHEIH